MKSYIPALVMSVIVLCAHLAGLHSFYYTIPQYDIFMHIIGGISIAFFLHGLVISSSPQHETRGKIIFAVFIVGVAWELFEAYYNIAGAPVGSKAYYIDTIKDLCDDVIGAVIATYFIFRNNTKSVGQ